VDGAPSPDAPPAAGSSSTTPAPAASSEASAAIMAPAETRVVAPEPPPVVYTETRPAPPTVEYVWAPGYWYWYGGRYVWVGGGWLPPRPGYAYVSARWVYTGDGWVFAPGGWAYGSGDVIVYPVYRHAYLWSAPPAHHRHHHHHRAHEYRHDRPRRAIVDGSRAQSRSDRATVAPRRRSGTSSRRVRAAPSSAAPARAGNVVAPGAGDDRTRVRARRR
jgi:hypothetical protein